MATGTQHTLERDYAIVSGGAGILDRSERGKLDVTGPDAAEFLQGQVTNDVLALQEGQACYAALLDPKAHIQADMRVFCAAAEQLWIDTEQHTHDAVLGHLRMYKIGRQVEIADRTAERAIVSLLGPAAAEIAARAGDAGRIAPTEAGVDLITASEAKEQVWAALVEAGAQPVAEEAAEILRVEHGIPRHGVDMSADNLPGEAGIVERAVSFTKGCYIGQEPVARMYHRGRPNRRLRGLRLTAPVEAAAPVRAQDKEVGTLTSSVVSPRLGAIGLAILRREIESGAEVQVADGVRATVVELPFEPA